MVRKSARGVCLEARLVAMRSKAEARPAPQEEFQKLTPQTVHAHASGRSASRRKEALASVRREQTLKKKKNLPGCFIIEVVISSSLLQFFSQSPISEDEPAPLVLKMELPKNLWVDEDVDENDVKDSWEDEYEPDPAPVAEPPAEKPTKKSVAKGSEKKGKTVEVVKEEPLDPVAEKLRQQRLVEEADYKNTTELFAKKGGDDKSLENFIPKSESDFLEYAELISHKLRPYEKSFHYIGLLKAVMRLSMTSLKAADAKEVTSSVAAIANEKLKAEKEANAGKKKSGPKKKQLIVDKPDDDVVVDKYDSTFDDYDFM